MSRSSGGRQGYWGELSLRLGTGDTYGRLLNDGMCGSAHQGSPIRNRHERRMLAKISRRGKRRLEVVEKRSPSQ